MKYLMILICITVLLGDTTAQQSSSNLQCEHLENPLGIDALHPRFSWQSTQMQRTFTLVVSTDSIALASNKLDAICWKRTGSDEQLVTYGGRYLRPFTRYYWRVTLNGQQTSPVASFETGPISADDWKGDWVSDTKDANLKLAACFRKAFILNKEVKSARIYIACGGLYELSINGKKVGDHVLDPAFTRYDRRNLYVSYNVSKRISQGKNAIGVILGNGWYNMQSTAVWFFDKAPWRQRPCFCLVGASVARPDIVPGSAKTSMVPSGAANAPALPNSIISL